MVKNFDAQGNNYTYTIFLRLVLGVAVAAPRRGMVASKLHLQVVMMLIILVKLVRLA